MSYKKIDPCLKNAFDDEMLFVLMARDKTAPLVILRWIELNLGKQPKEKLLEAFECAVEMMEQEADINKVKEYAKKYPEYKYTAFKELYNSIVQEKYPAPPVDER